MIATGRRAVDAKDRPNQLRSIEVTDRGRPDFLVTGKVTTERRRTKRVSSGDLGLGRSTRSGNI